MQPLNRSIVMRRVCHTQYKALGGNRNCVCWIEVRSAVNPPSARYNDANPISCVGVRSAHKARIPLYEHEIGSGPVRIAVEFRHLRAFSRKSLKPATPFYLIGKRDFCFRWIDSTGMGGDC